MPTFDSILDLVNHYCSLSQSERAKSHIWVDNVTGNLYSPICLRKPLKKEVSTLAHSARIPVNQSLKSQNLLPELNLPNRITNFLGEISGNVGKIFLKLGVGAVILPASPILTPINKK